VRGEFLIQTEERTLNWSELFL